MNSCDALIVGAGPAGSTCARLLKRGGLDVLVMDRCEFPRDKLCAGWITPAVLEALEIDPEGYRQGHLLQEIREFRTALGCGREQVTSYRKAVSYGIRRWEFDHYLLLRSAARHRLGEAVCSLERVPDGWVVNGSIRARLVIGAGGHNCPVARVIGPSRGREGVFAAQCCEFPLGPEQLAACTIPAGVPALFFTEDLQGYGWLLRKGSYLNVGLGSMATGGLPRRRAAFCAYLEKRGGVGGDLPQRFRGHAYLPFRYPAGRPLVADAALLVGDAAGVSFAESGEGILPAVESAILAVHTILAAHGDYRKEKLMPYADRLAARLGAPRDLPIPFWLRRIGAAALFSSAWLTRRFILDRFFLHADFQPLTLPPRQRPVPMESGRRTGKGASGTFPPTSP